MLLQYAKIKEGNFGDDVNSLLWNHLFPDFFDNNENKLFIGIGTILHNRYPENAQKIVFSSGGGYRTPPKINSNWNIYGVRGKITAKLLGLPGSSAIGDGAYLLKHTGLFQPQNNQNKIGFIPHHGSVKYINWELICNSAGILYIDPCQSPDIVLGQILTCKKILTEAMHGAIFADSFRIPWIPVRYSHKILELKWEDWLSVLDLKFKFYDLPYLLQSQVHGKDYFKRRVKFSLKEMPFAPKRWQRMPYKISSEGQFEKMVSTIDHIARNENGLLSDDYKLEKVEGLLMSKVEKFKKDFGIT